MILVTFLVSNFAKSVESKMNMKPNDESETLKTAVVNVSKAP